MEPIKIAGLTLKSESKVGEAVDMEKILHDANENFPVNPNDATEEPDASQEDFPPTITRVPTITEELLRITKRVEELPKSDTNIKALAKLKGALELLA